MNQNWIVENLNNAFSTWNGKLTELWGLVTTSPQTFKGGAVWGVMQSLHNAMIGIGYALIVLFFAISLFKNTANFHELKRPEAAVHYLIRFVAAKTLVGYGMDIMLNIFSICNGIVSDMRDLGSKCNVVEIYVRDNELSGFTRRRKLDSPTNVSIEIARIAFDLFKRNYSWPKPLRGIGVRGADLCSADCAIQLGFFSNEEKREKLENIDKAVDTLRQRYGYRSVQRAIVYTDPVLGGINAYDDHNIHPVGYFHTA